MPEHTSPVDFVWDLLKPVSEWPQGLEVLEGRTDDKGNAVLVIHNNKNQVFKLEIKRTRLTRSTYQKGM